MQRLFSGFARKILFFSLFAALIAIISASLRASDETSLEDGEVVYLVRETKGGRDLSKLQFPTERMKILYGVKHFDAVGADYDWLEKASEVEPKSRVKRKS